MSKAKKSSSANSNAQIINNKKASHDYFFEEHFEAGLALEGWEVKALRAGRVQLKDAHVLIKNGEVYLFGTTITPLPSASTHYFADPIRTRKLLLHRREIDKLIGAAQRDGYTLIPVRLYWKNRRIKLDLAVAKGKKEYDKRATSKDREWQLDKARLMKNRNLNRE